MVRTKKRHGDYVEVVLSSTIVIIVLCPKPVVHLATHSTTHSTHYVNSPIIAVAKHTILLPNAHNRKGGEAGIKCACALEGSRHLLHFGTFSVFGRASNACVQATWQKAVLLRANTTTAKV